MLIRYPEYRSVQRLPCVVLVILIDCEHSRNFRVHCGIFYHVLHLINAWRLNHKYFILGHKIPLHTAQRNLYQPYPPLLNI